MRVLLVEDDVGIRTAVGRVLHAHGHDVAEASGAADACAAIAQQPFAALVIDVNLPDAPGWEILDCLHRGASVCSDPRVIVMSAVPPSVERVREFQPDAVLIKPFPVSSLLRLVADAPVAPDDMELS